MTRHSITHSALLWFSGLGWRHSDQPRLSVADCFQGFSNHQRLYASAAYPSPNTAVRFDDCFITRFTRNRGLAPHYNLRRKRAFFRTPRGVSTYEFVDHDHLSHL